MTQVFEVSGMHCSGCSTRVQRAAEALAPGAAVTLDPPRLVLPDGAAVDAEPSTAGWRSSATIGSRR